MSDKRIVSFYLLCIISFFTCVVQADFFSKVIIWGHPLHSHTHSYIHWGFYRAFVHMGYEVYWVSNEKEMPDIDLYNALFITEGQVDQAMPKRKDCYYILHNCKAAAYQELLQNNRCIMLQVYTHSCLPYVSEKLGKCMFSNSLAKIIFLPWATDLLPYEIDAMKKINIQKKRKINWIGTIGEGVFGNNNEIIEFKKACTENNIVFQDCMNVSMDRNIQLIQESYMAPALQGKWQCENGYIPCRIFKNISYGQWGITNNRAVYDLFEGKIIYNADTYQLFYDAKTHIESAEIAQLHELMDFVRDNHTYVNRIQILLDFMQKALYINGSM